MPQLSSILIYLDKYNCIVDTESERPGLEIVNIEGINEKNKL